jgi:hypothetical protein
MASILQTWSECAPALGKDATSNGMWLSSLQQPKQQLVQHCMNRLCAGQPCRALVHCMQVADGNSSICRHFTLSLMAWPPLKHHLCQHSMFGTGTRLC